MMRSITNLPKPASCRCFMPPPFYADFTSLEIGSDTTQGRHALITTETCIHCGTIWLKYEAEEEHYTASGRWYRGIIAKDLLRSLQPQDAISYLESLPWYIYGGSFFDTTGKYGSGKLVP